MAAEMTEKGMAAVNQMPLWELEQDYALLGIFYVANDGKATMIGTEDWDD